MSSRCHLASNGNTQSLSDVRHLEDAETGHFFGRRKATQNVNLRGFTSGTGWSPIKEAMYRAKIATLEEEAIRIRVGARFLGFAMSNCQG